MSADQIATISRAEMATALPGPGDGCQCTELVAEYEPACPEYSEHVWNPRAGMWEHRAETTTATRHQEGRPMTNQPEPAELLPAESIALTVALAQVRRGDEPDPNTAAMCVLALARLAGRHDWTEVAE